MANKPHSTSDEGKKMPYKLIKEITHDFNESHKLGSGGFGTVYKGELLDGGEIAVKVLHMARLLDNSQFQKELMNLTRANHQNIVKLVGFCIESQEEPWEFRSNQISKQQTALCFEYVHGGSLQKLISDEKTGLDWHARYKIIRGICDGLEYLHKGLDSPLWHLDLRPSNILVDKNMVPKIVDYGLRRLFGEEKRTGISSMATCGYCPPGYMEKQIISPEYDIYTLGVVILKIMAGDKGDELFRDMGREKFVDHVHDNWSCSLSKIFKPILLEAYCKQVKRCIEIGLECINRNQFDRPTIVNIVSSLTGTEKVILDFELQIEQLHEEEPSLPKKDIQKRLSPEIIEDVSTSKTQESESSILNTPEEEIPLNRLKEVTHDFKQKLGEDAFGTAYKGEFPDGKVIVVKRLKENSPVPPEKVFINEIQNIMDLRHENIVRLVGYWTEGQRKVVQKNGKYIVDENIKCYLCYEYLHGGSLDAYISGESSKSDWDTRFKIINGICDGLHFLHTKKQIIHMDLKPQNVLLDNNMVAKITGFGMSKIIGKEQTHEKSVVGSYGYIAPEYFDSGEISTQTDIYSLGLTIIEIVTLERNCYVPNEPSGRRFIDKVLEEWTYDHIVSAYPCVDDTISFKQIIACIEIGQQCVEIDRKKRPSIEDIVNKISCTFQN